MFIRPSHLSLVRGKMLICQQVLTDSGSLDSRVEAGTVAGSLPLPASNLVISMLPEGYRTVQTRSIMEMGCWNLGSAA